MLAIVFFMQPMGQLVATLVALIAVYASRDSLPHTAGIEGCGDDCIRAVDRTWRWIIGCGAIPAAIALVFRLTVPESPRWTSAVARNSSQALDDTTYFASTTGVGPIEEDVEPNGAAIEAVGGPATATIPRGPVSLREIVRYFCQPGPARSLAGTALSWLLLDLPFYGLMMNNPRVIDKLWNGRPSENDSAIYRTLFENSTHSLVVAAIGAIVGGLLMIAFAHRINRRKLQIWGFCILGCLFIIIGSSFGHLLESRFQGAIVPLYILCQIFFNFGTKYVRSSSSVLDDPFRQG